MNSASSGAEQARVEALSFLASERRRLSVISLRPPAKLSDQIIMAYGCIPMRYYGSYPIGCAHGTRLMVGWLYGLFLKNLQIKLLKIGAFLNLMLYVFRLLIVYCVKVLFRVPCMVWLALVQPLLVWHGLVPSRGWAMVQDRPNLASPPLLEQEGTKLCQTGSGRPRLKWAVLFTFSLGGEVEGRLEIEDGEIYQCGVFNMCPAMDSLPHYTLDVDRNGESLRLMFLLLGEVFNLCKKPILAFINAPNSLFECAAEALRLLSSFFSSSLRPHFLCAGE
eukprot:Gb_22316 [translate_table: standard]